MRKLLVLVLAIALLSGVPVFSMNDQPSTWASSGVEFMINENLVPLALQSDYQKAITREEFTQLIIPIVEKLTKEEVIVWTENFSDTASKSVNKAFSASIVTGVGNNKFNPSGLITREQIAIMYVNALNYISWFDENGNNSLAYSYKNTNMSDFSKVSSWAKGYVTLAINNEIMNGKGNNLFAPAGNTTREEAILISYNVYQNLLNKNHVSEVTLKAGKEIAPSLKQAIYLGSGKKAIDVDLLSFVGKNKSAVEKVFGVADETYIDVWGNDIAFHGIYGIQFAYKDGIVVGASCYWFSGNKAFTGTLGKFEKEYTILEAVNTFDGELIDSSEYGMTFLIVNLGAGYYSEMLWDLETEEFLQTLVLKGNYSYK